MSTSRLSRLQQLPVIQFAMRRFRRIGSLVVMTVAILALLSTTIAISQASLDFDLACRSVITGGGRIVTGGFYGLNGSLGLPIVPPKETEVEPTYAVRSIDYGLRAGYLPGYPNDISPSAANVSVPGQAFVQRLPFINKVARIVRGGC